MVGDGGDIEAISECDLCRVGLGPCAMSVLFFCTHTLLCSVTYGKFGLVFRRPPATVASSSRMSIGVPIKLMHEAESHIITVELKTGEVCKIVLIVP